MLRSSLEEVVQTSLGHSKSEVAKTSARYNIQWCWSSSPPSLLSLLHLSSSSLSLSFPLFRGVTLWRQSAAALRSWKTMFPFLFHWKMALSLNLPPSLLPEMVLWQPDHFQQPRGGADPRRRRGRRRGRRKRIKCVWWRMCSKRTELLRRVQLGRGTVVVHWWQTATFQRHRVVLVLN